VRSPPSLRALILLTLVLDIPVLRRLVCRFTGKPVVGSIEVGDFTSHLVQPRGRGPWPTYLFVNGAHPDRRREPVVDRLLEGLARAGYQVLAPDPPGLSEGRIGPETLETLVRVIEVSRGLPSTRSGRVAVLGVSTGASLALLAASDPRISNSLSVVVSVTPYADLEKILALATTQTYPLEPPPDRSRHEVTDLLRASVVRSMVATLPDAIERARLETEIEPDPIAAIAGVRGYSPDAMAIVRLLTNESAEDFKTCFAALPETVRAHVHALSPSTTCRNIRAPVELVVPPDDLYFPRAEVESLARSIGRCRLTVTPTLDHTRPSVTVRRLGSLFGFGRFVLRGLRAAA
jgi:pimeloyl-ACP methyl ester carboxylesterase